MPERLRQLSIKIGQSIRQKVKERNGRVYFPILVDELAQRYGADLVGYGGECAIIGREEEFDKVDAIYYSDLSPEGVKKIFYLQRIFSTLFPHNFPRFYLCVGGSFTDGNQNAVTGVVRQRVTGRPTTFKEIQRSREKIRYPFRKVLDFRNDLNIPVFFDAADCNFVVAEDGGEYYLDRIMLRTMGKWDLAETMEWMNRVEPSDYKRREKSIVRRSVKRLAELELMSLIRT